MKIGVVNVVANSLLEAAGYLALQRRNLEKALGPNVELVIESGANDDFETCLELLFNPFFTSLDGRNILEKLYQLQEDGCDGVIISCTQDPLLVEARSLLHIPIVGAVEASILSACMTGEKFGFLMFRDRRVAEITENIVARYGLQSRMAPMVYASERLSKVMMEAFHDPELARDELAKGCRDVIESGAHSVILGGTSLSNIATACGISQVPEFNAPVFDPICVAARMLRYRIELQHSLGIPPTSRAGIFRQFPAPVEAQLMQSFGFNP